MKKTFVLIFCILISVQFVLAADIAYIVKNSNYPDTVLTSLIDEKGYSYDIIDDSDISTTDFEQYKIILVDKGNFGSDADDIPVNEKSSVVLNTRHLDDWRWLSDGISSISPNRPQELPVLEDSMIVDGIGSGFIPYIENGMDPDTYRVYYLHKADQAPDIVTIVADDLNFLQYLRIYVPKNGAVIATINKGDRLIGGQTTNARGVFFGIPNTDLWTLDTKQIFKNSLQWALEGEEPNQPPVLTTIPDLQWQEGESIELNLDDYFSDPNGDDLSYGIADTSNNDNIIVNIIDSIVYFTSVAGWTGQDWIQFYASDGEAITNSNNVILTVGSLPPIIDFSDAPQCTERAEQIEIKIKEPDQGDEYEVGETIEIEIKVENNFDENLDFEVEAHLYDLDEEESLEDVDKDEKIKDGDDEIFEFEIEIPNDVEEENDHAVYVYVEDEENRCNAAYVEIDIEREDEAIRIKEFEIVPQAQNIGGNLELIVEVENIGSDEQDVYVKVENVELGLDLESEVFEVEEYDEDDTESTEFYFTLPVDIQLGGYEITASVFIEGEIGEEDSKTKILTVKEITRTDQTYTYTSGGVIYLGDSTGVSGGIPLLVSDVDSGKPGIGLIVRDVGVPSDRISSGEIYLGEKRGDYFKFVSDKDEVRETREKRTRPRFPLFYKGDNILIKNLLTILNIVLAVGSLVIFILIIEWIVRRR